MPIPTRPVSHADIATDWGQAIHDDTFAPKGTSLYSVTTRSISTSALGLFLDTADDDPGGWLDSANNRAEVPTDLDGLYLITATVDSVNGTAGDFTRIFLLVNGTAIASAIAINEGGTHVTAAIADIVTLTAGDLIALQAQKRGSGSNITAYITKLKIVRLGRELGA